MSAHRNPVTAPAIGFSPYTPRHFSGSFVAEYMTGVRKNHTRTKNGTRYRTSRYNTFNALSQSPTASAASMANATHSGIVTAAHVGATLNHTISGTSSADAIRKSTTPLSTAAEGMISRGK